MRGALVVLAGALVAAVPAAGSTPSARILFDQPASSQFDLVETDADATGYRNLTPGDQPFYVGDQNGSWSPDGSRIVFESHRDSNVSTEIYVMDADGSNQQRLTHDGPEGVQNVGGSVFDTVPLWSPRGNLIAYQKSVNSRGEIWLMAPDGSGQHALTQGMPVVLVQWFPDGSRLLYQQGDSFYSIPVTGGPGTKIATGMNPVVSPDGSRVAYVVPGQGLSVVGADGRDARALTTTLPAQEPSWSPDGTRIAFVGTTIFPELTSRFGPAQRSDIYTIRVDGTGLQRLTGSFDENYSSFPSGGTPTWWPDGSRLFFLSGRNEPQTTYQMNPDGSCEGRFGTPGGPQLWRPLWRPGSQPGLGPLRCVDLRLTLMPTSHPAALGESVPMSFLVDNDGSEPATAVRVELKASVPVELGGGPGCSGPPLDVVCTIDFLAPRASQVVTFTARSTTGGNYPLTVTAGALEQDSDPSTNTIQTGIQVLKCTEVGTFGDDVLFGTSGPDRICGLTGADRIYGGSGDDYIDSGNGADIVVGGPGHDTILTKGGNDTVYARDGQRDWIDCGTERDVAVVDRFDRTFHCETVVRPKRR
jgi:Tol biopolymer transport system component